MRKSIFCLVNSESNAQRIVDELVSSGFSHEDISLVYPDRTKENIRTDASGDVEYVEKDFDRRRSNITTEKHTKAPEGAATGATAGGILGGSLGLLAGIGSLAIPGLGAFIAAGPIMAALSGSAVGGGLGLLLGALIGSGIPEFEAKKYESGLKAGNILLSVHTDSEEELNRANEIMKKNGGQDISTSREKTQSSY